MNAASRQEDAPSSDRFRQDIATFYDALNPLDGVSLQKVLQADCLLENCRWTVTEHGLGIHTEHHSLFLTGKDGFPLQNPTCLALGNEGTLWVGSERGAARLQKGTWRYFGGKRWLPHDRVEGIAIDLQNRAWLATPDGFSCIESIDMTWEAKAAHYEQITQARHNRDGWVTECLLTRPVDLDSFLYEASDNDGLWTALYLCAECFRYAVTQEEEARCLARRSLNALLKLVTVTGIPGFPARAAVRRNERAQMSVPQRNWIQSPVDADMLYKGDTSSDEIDGHYLAWYVYYELVADEEEKRAIANVCHAVTSHILDNNYTLVGANGKRTSWGVWTPELLNNDPQWKNERGLNSLEMLSHLRVAMRLSPCERFAAAYQTLIKEHGYALNTIRQKVLPPEGDNNHSDDELAACAYYPLLMLETDPMLRQLYLLSLEQTQSILRPERSPFYNIIYTACAGKPCDVDAITEWLQDAPLDLRDWKMENSHRPDVVFAPDLDRFGKRQLTTPLPPGERGVTKWNENPYLADSGTGGTREMDGAFWLLPYWMGRRYGVGVRIQGSGVSLE